MHQLSPQETFPIVYLLSDPNDTATYYIRSVVRNSATGAVIQIGGQNFVNLVQSPTNTRRFSLKIQAPNDASGLGLWIDITTTVYVDSGYTTPSPNYVEQLDKYLVQTRWVVGLGGGGGTGRPWDPNEFKKLITEAILALELSKSTDQLAVRQRLDSLESSIRNSLNNNPTISPDNLENAVASLMKHVSETVAQIDIPKIPAPVNVVVPPVDHTPVLEKIAAIQFPDFPDYTPALEDLKNVVTEGFKKPAPVIETVLEPTIAERVKKIVSPISREDLRKFQS